MLPLPDSGQCHYTVAFSPDGRRLAAGGSDYAVDVWDLHAPQNPARRLQSLNGPVVRARFAPGGSLVAVSTGWLAAFDAETLTFRRTRQIGSARPVALPPDGLTAILFDGALRRFAVNGADERLNWSRDEVPGPVADLAAEGGRVLVARGSRTGGAVIDVRDADRGECIGTVSLPRVPHRVACSADVALAATLDRGHLSVWDLAAGAPVVERTGGGHGGWLSVAFDPRGRWVATGGIDSTVAVWDAASAGPPLQTFQWGVGPVYAIAFDRDGLRAAAAGHAGAIVWDMDE